MALILMVDDDPTVREIGKALLGDAHAVVEASDGLEALALARRLPVDLIVLDMLMPNKDGLETLTALSAQSTRPKILAISGGGLLEANGLLKIARAFGADATMQKPLRVGEFRSVVDDLLAMDGASSRRQTA